jgi:hypothetical protein
MSTVDQIPRAHVIDFSLLDGVVLEVTVCRPIQRRRRVGTFAVHNAEATVAQHVEGRSLPRAHVIDFGLDHDVVLEVPVCRPIQRRRRVGTFAVHNTEATVAQHDNDLALPKARVTELDFLDGVVLEVPVCRPIQRR